jgi:hypothetical protein
MLQRLEAMSSVYKYIDLCSTYRNRNYYPNPADFVAPISYGLSSVSNAFQAQDPIVDGVPSVINVTQAGSTNSMIVLAADSSPITNFYDGLYLQIGTQYRVIQSYDAATQTATINTTPPATPFPGLPPPAGTQYYIRAGIPVYSATLVAPVALGPPNPPPPTATNTQNVVYLGTTSSAIVPSIDGYFTGYYIYFTSGANVGIAALISQYTGLYRAAVLAKALPNVPAVGDAYDILQYTGDNVAPLIYSGTIGFNQPVCYSIELLYLTIPNQLLSSGYGGNLKQYPYLYLYFYNEGNMHADHTLYTNNPNVSSATFKIPVGLNLTTETFFTLKDAKMIQVCKFKPDQPVHFRLVLPDGTPIVFATPDNLSPLPPNPLLQISGCFAIRRIDGEVTRK